jgi:hypothetical protein
VWDVDEGFTFDDCLPAVSGHTTSGGGGFHTASNGTGAVDEAAVNVAPGNAYFWKVIADDDMGGSVESETWRFETD